MTTLPTNAGAIEILDWKKNKRTRFTSRKVSTDGCEVEGRDCQYKPFKSTIFDAAGYGDISEAIN